jgi:hypothetical protein
MSSTINTVSKWNEKLINFLENPIIKYGFLILIVIQIFMIKELSTSYLKIFDDILFKVIYAFLIAYYACFDPVYAIALTTLMIISIQELHSRNATHSVVSLLPELKTNSTIPNVNIHPIQTIQTNLQSNNNLFIKSNKMAARVFDNDELVYELINKNSLQKQPDINDKLTSEYEFCQEPAYQTITKNITKSLTDIQNNQELNVSQYKSMQGLEGDILNIQGLPNGFDQNNKL